jgi:hypothetical protein
MNIAIVKILVQGFIKKYDMEFYFNSGRSNFLQVKQSVEDWIGDQSGDEFQQECEEILGMLNWLEKSGNWNILFRDVA